MNTSANAKPSFVNDETIEIIDSCFVLSPAIIIERNRVDTIVAPTNTKEIATKLGSVLKEE